jgi:RNA polymerase sigma factor (sigma-70 family)
LTGRDGFLHRIALRVNRDGRYYDDLMQVGRIAMWRARSTFDSRRGVAFATYATWRAWSAMMHAVRAEFRVASHRADTAVVRDAFETDSLAEFCVIDPDLERVLAAIAFAEGLACLPALERAVILAHYGQDRTLVEIAQASGFAINTISRRHQTALKRLRMESVDRTQTR